MALAQQTATILLDERPPGLDLRYQVDILEAAPDLRPRAAAARW